MRMRKYCTAGEWAAETGEGYSVDDLNVLAIEHHAVSGHPIESEQEKGETEDTEAGVTRR